MFSQEGRNLFFCFMQEVYGAIIVNSWMNLELIEHF